MRAGLEECDDGDNDDDDACTTECRFAVCGDGYIRGGFEECDDGNRFNSDSCLNDCTVAFCGDGLVNAGVEECDDGNETDTTCAQTPVHSRSAEMVSFAWDKNPVMMATTSMETAAIKLQTTSCGNGILNAGRL